MMQYPSPSSITMQRSGDRPVTITLEDAVVIMTNQQKTIEELIANNQKMFQFIQQAQNSGGFGNIQFAQQNLSDPASHLYNNLASSSSNSMPVREKPMTLNEYLARKKNGQASNSVSSTPTNTTASTTTTSTPTSSTPTSSTPTSSTTTSTPPMTLSEFLALKKSNASAETSTVDDVPVFDTPSKI